MSLSSARLLGGRLRDIAQRLRRDQPDKAASKVRDLFKKLADVRRDGKITQAAHQEIIASLDQLALALPDDDGDHDRD